MNFLRDALHSLEQVSGFGDVTGRVLADAELGHLMDKLCVEEALFARLGLVGARFEGGDGIGIGKIVVA